MGCGRWGGSRFEGGSALARAPSSTFDAQVSCVRLGLGVRKALGERILRNGGRGAKARGGGAGADPKTGFLGKFISYRDVQIR